MQLSNAFFVVMLYGQNIIAYPFNMIFLKAPLKTRLNESKLFFILRIP